MARILLAEDDDQMRAFLSRGLRRAGHAGDAVGRPRHGLRVHERAVHQHLKT